MKKRKFKAFITCFLVLILCSSLINAVTGPMKIENNCIEEHKNDEDSNEETQDKNKEDSKKDKADETNEILKDKEEPKDEKEDNTNQELDKKESNLDGEKNKQDTNPTEDIFENAVGNYNLSTILNKTNIFSFGDVTASHIVGPIIAKRAYREDQRTGKLIFADYTNGNPSYVGEVRRLQAEWGIGTEAEISLTYGFENQAPPNVDLSIKPNLYVNESENKVRIKLGDNQSDVYWMSDEEKEDFKGPNNNGASPILQNDKFMDYEKAMKEILKESKALAESNGNIVVGKEEKYKIDAEGKLKIDVGKSYVIEDASNLKTVDISFPEGFHPITNPYPYPTNISILDKNMVSTVILGKKQNIFPQILINGTQFTGMVTGEGGFGDGQIGSRNRLIWNMPNLETTGDEGRLVKALGSDILGHIVAPNAEFWNYREENKKFKWNGGNMNGCAIVKAWHGGTLESHYWPYDGDVKIPDIPRVSMSVNAEKIFNKGNLDNPKFNFILEYDDKSLPDGILNENIPQTVQQEADGSIKFLPITFTKAGEYKFKIKEIQGDDKDIIYDGSEYKVKVTVKLVDGKLEYTKEVTKVKDNVSSPVDEIVFVNEKILNFTIEKKDNLTGSLLEGAMFDLYEADESGKPKGEPIIKDITTDSTGKINVSNKVLDYNKLYVLVETKAPDGYMTGENIVFYIKGEEGLYPSVDGVIEIGNSGVVEVLNTKSDEVLPETGGVGTDKFIFAGLGLMLSSLIILRFKLIKG